LKGRGAMKLHFISWAAAAALVFALSGCESASMSQQTQGQIIGGVTGAAVGSMFGGGTGQVIATGAGAVLGTMAGGNIGRRLDEGS